MDYRGMVPGAGIEPARHYVSRDFKSLASTYSATQASCEISVYLSVFPVFHFFPKNLNSPKKSQIVREKPYKTVQQIRVAFTPYCLVMQVHSLIHHQKNKKPR